MSRLFYDQTKPKLMSGNNNSAANLKVYLEKVAKVVPAEIIAAYLSLMAFVPLIEDTSLHKFFYIGIFVFGALVTPYYFNAQADKGKPKVIHICLSSLSFIVWAYQTTGEKIFTSYDSAIASIVLIVFTVLTGKIPLK